MKQQRMIVGLMMVSVTMLVCAADRTWDGGGINANWSIVTNWDGDLTAPVADDALYFGGSTKLVNTNDLTTDTSFAGLTFNSGAGAFTLWGNRITLGGNVTNWSSNTQTINLPVNLSGTRAFNASNGTLTVNGLLSGSGGLTKFGPQSMSLTASNSYEGVTTVSNGTLAITHGNALGSTNGNTVVTCASGGYFQLGGGITVPEPITLSGDRPSGGSILNSSGSNTLTGALSMVGSIRTGVNGGSMLVVRGGVLRGSGSGSWLILNSVGTLAFYDTPLNIGNNIFFCNPAIGGGVVVLGVAGNTWAETWILSGTLRLDIINALPAAAPLYIGNSLQADGILDLNGYNQTVNQLFGPPLGKAATGYLTSTKPATLTVDQGVNTTYDRPLNGLLSLLKIGAGTLTLSNSLSTTTGNITVTNGTLVVAIASSLGNSTNVTATGAAATLELKTASGIADTASLSLADGAKLKIGTGLAETVGSLILDGVQKVHGTWGPSGSGAKYTDDVHFTGGGKIVVLSDPPVTAVNATWDAEGGADTFVSTAINWAGDALPAFDGTTYALFGTGGSVATVDRVVSLYGMTFNRDGSFTVAAGAGAMTNGAGGITAAVPNTTSRAYALAEDLTLIAHQVWNVTNNGTGVATLTVSGSINAEDAFPFTLTKIGNGTLVLSGSNTYDGVTTVGNGILEIANAKALGSTNGNTVVTCSTGGYLQLSGGITVEEPITLSGELPSVGGSILNRVGSNTLYGAITTIGQIRTKVNGGTTLVVRGGVRNGDSGSFNLIFNAAGTLAFYDKPLNLGNNNFFCNVTGGTLVLGVAGNTWADTQIYSGTLRLDITNALPAAVPLKVGLAAQADGILDLNGYNQIVSQLLGPPLTVAATGYMTSTKPATLTVDQSVSTTYNRPLNGALSLLKIGTGTLTLSNNLSTTTGNITVTNGTLVVAPASNLGNSTNVTVIVPGTLTLQTSSGIADSANLLIVGTAKVSLAAGVNETVGSLYIDGKRQRRGTYSATGGGGVQVVDAAHFAGTGILTVLHDKSGMLLRVQ